MIRPEVTVLYKYYGVCDESLTALRTGAFWFANPRTFNDPFDCALTLREDALRESVQDALETNYTSGAFLKSIPTDFAAVMPEDAEAYAIFRENVSHTLDSAGLFCLTEVPTDLLMWSHYADAHRGFCIGFERTATNTLGRKARPVKYESQYPHLSAANFNPATNPNSAEQLWLIKALNWAYEREWRVMADDGNRAYTFDAAISSVIFGLRTSEKGRDSVRDALSSNAAQPTFYQAVAPPNQFELQLSRLER